MSRALKEFAKRIAEQYGIQPLRPGQRRPDGYYVSNRATGRCKVPRGAVVNIQPTATEMAVADGHDKKP